MTSRRTASAAVSLAGLAAVLLAAPAARADDVKIGIPTRVFSPGQVNLVPGDRVTWSNADILTHEVRAVDGSFDSGLLPHGDSFTRTFTQVGHTPFLCPIHPFMTGEVDVRAATLDAPKDVFAGTAVRLTGRVPAGTAGVTLQRRAADGSWQDAGSAAPAATGAYAFAVQPAESVVYRTSTSLGTSPEVTLKVTTRLRAGLTVRRSARGVVVRVTATPATPGLNAVLERYARWHFAWRRGRAVKLDGHGRATFTLPRRADGLVRVSLQRGMHGATLATTPATRLRDGRRVADPIGGTGHPHGSATPMPHAGADPMPH